MNEGQMIVEATLNTMMDNVANEVSETVPTVPETVVVATPVEAAPETVVVAKKGKAKRKPGRPRLYNGKDRIVVAAALKKHGLTKGIEFLAKERNLKVSMTLARSVAEEKGLTFTRGRPKVAA